MKTEPPVRVLTPAYYERLAALEAHHWWWRGIRRITEALGHRISTPRRDWRVLDAGCGTGGAVVSLGRDTAAAPVGLDRSADALGFSRARGCRRLVQGDAAALPFADRRFDLALSLDVIQHLPRPGGDRAALAELHRVLADRGWLLLRTNSRCGRDRLEAHDYYRYGRGEVRALLRHAGFDCDVLSYANALPALVSTIGRGLRGQRPEPADPGLPHLGRSAGGLLPRLGYAWLAAEALWLRRTALPLPFGHTIVALARKRE